MCYAYGSLDQATGVCPMCKVFKPIGNVRVSFFSGSTPQMRTLLKRLTVQTFSGCGFCKWAATNPPARLSGYQNPGWPGCCRPPLPEEQRHIGAADWPAVSVVHRTPIPPEIKSLLDSITGKGGSGSPGGSARASNTQTFAPTMSRRASHQIGSPTRLETTSARIPVAPIPVRGRSGGSPQQATAALTNNTTRNANVNGDGTASSLPSRSPMDQYQPPPRRSNTDGDRRSESVNASQHSPGHKNVDLGGSLSRRNVERRPSLSAALPATPANKIPVEPQPQRRRQQTQQPPNRMSPPPITSNRAAERQSTAPPPLQRRASIVEKSLASMSISSASSSSSGSNSETTVISDGGFTDYLSDESEAELQRQAEAKAALVAQNQLEEQEFKAARQQLASVDLQPPRSWNGNNSTPRSQVSASHSTCVQSSPYAAAVYSASGASIVGSTHSRG
ncbi:hypothetical protein POSPLADRAFT_1048580 [Postia placenta MAD-698-R-SB12]|uniref:Uncharacterized protein n=1 Tax=Postia placenta MAD-698-R-SB12 TaxID=670580 RepID=A0A1X6MS77_9APHY|nr:hypothetical protein POSPLADRAFT_1048580 [Postia placenta MAD-698-R-SB12]OSX59241.1 hypothetical protein POSPLADRAFT_1048580 [Postia placenta MAD-698-R-SB12]